MMTLYRLVHMIEKNSQALSANLVNEVKDSEATPEYRLVPNGDLKEQVYEIYRHLGEWLITNDELDLEQRYCRIGARRARQNVPFSQVAWAIVLTKDNLWEFLKKESEIERPVEVLGEMELFQLLDKFFDRAIYYAAVGYEKARANVEAEKLKVGA